MARGLAFQEGGFYHIYNRGTDKRDIFNCSADYERFISLLYLANSAEPVRFRSGRGPASVKSSLELARMDPLTDICAYVLMPNHFHLLLHESIEHGLSRFLHRLSTSYVMYFNTRYERNGVLFQGKFKAVAADKDRYLKYLISYIHLNPIKLLESRWKELGIHDAKKAQRFLEAYPYSSYQDYCGIDRIEQKILNRSVLPEYFKSPADFKSTTSEWLNYQNS